MRQAWREQNYILLVLMVILGLTPVFRNGYGSESLLYLFALAAVTGIIYIIQRRHLGFSLPMLYIPLVLFLVWSALSFFWTANPHQTLAELWRLGLYMLVFTLTATLRNGESRKLQRFLITIGTAIAVVGILQYLFVGSGRITSTFMNSNPLGIYLGMVTLIALFNLFAKERRAWRAALVVAINASGMVLTGSRGSLLAFAVALIIGLVGMDRSYWKTVLWGIGRAALLSAILIFLLVRAAPSPPVNEGPRNIGKIIQSIILNLVGQDQGDRLSISRPLNTDDTSVLGRWSYWQVAGRMIKANPWSGIGLSSYQSAYFAYWDGDNEYSKYTHNHYLQTGAELGIPGMLFLMVFLVAFMINRWRARPRGELNGIYLGTWSAALAFLLHLIVDFTWYMPAVTITFWALMGGLAGTGQRDRRGHGLYAWRIPQARGVAILALALLVIVCGIQYGSFLLAQKGRLADIDGRVTEARNYFLKATSVYPYRSLYYQWLARVEAKIAGSSEKKADLAGALAAAERAVDVDPYNQEAYELLGRLQWRIGEVDAAEASLNRAVKYGGFYPAPFAALGNFYLSRARYLEAERVFRRGLELKDYAPAKADTDEEIDRLTASIIEMHLGLARVLDEREDYKAAGQELYKVLEIDPDNTVALRVLASYRARKLG
ncbi:MAG: O-antigen ligase family protein [Bacillota bacterium]